MLSIFLVSVERLAALTLIGASAAGCWMWPRSGRPRFRSIPTAFFAALLPAASHVDAASERTNMAGEPAGALSDGGALLEPVHGGICGGDGSFGQHRYARLVGSGVTHEGSLDPPVCGIQSCHAVPYADRTGNFDLSGDGTGLRRVQLLDSKSVSFWQSRCRCLGGSRGAWTPFGIGVAVSVATAGSACVLMGRVLFVLDLKLDAVSAGGGFAGILVLRGCRLAGVAGRAPGGELNRWQGAGVLAAAGLGLCGGAGCSVASVGFDGRREAKGVQDGAAWPGSFRGGREATA